MQQSEFSLDFTQKCYFILHAVYPAFNYLFCDNSVQLDETRALINCVNKKDLC